MEKAHCAGSRLFFFNLAQQIENIAFLDCFHSAVEDGYIINPHERPLEEMKTASCIKLENGGDGSRASKNVALNFHDVG